MTLPLSVILAAGCSVRMWSDGATCCMHVSGSCISTIATACRDTQWSTITTCRDGAASNTGMCRLALMRTPLRCDLSRHQCHCRLQGDFHRLAGDLANQYSDRARLEFSFDEPLSHLIYAGCDLILVPSMFEPCGLTQMIGMRYGTLAVVRKTGGLADTVFDVDHDQERAAEYGMEVRRRRRVTLLVLVLI